MTVGGTGRVSGGSFIPAGTDIGPRPSSSDLSAVLEGQWLSRAGGGRRIVRIARELCAYSTSFVIEELLVEDDAGGTRRMIFKNLGPAALMATAKTHRPNFLYKIGREIHVYCHLLDTQRMGTAEVLASVFDTAGERYWLFLEHVNGGQLRHVGELAAWEEAARWLARLHSHFQTRGSTLRRVPLLRYDANFFVAWLDRLCAKPSIRVPGALAASDLNVLRLAVRRAAELLELCPPTLVHGDFYPANVLIRQGNGDGCSWAVCPIDWEVAGIGPGVLDLAALTAGNWPDASRERMLRAYVSESSKMGAHHLPTPEQMLELLDACRVVTAVQWLAWSDGWSAPPDQARDWLADAREASRRLLNR